MTAITSLQTDSLAALRNTAARDPKAAIKEAAKQFEGLFMQELMKSMRQATMSSGMLDNEGTQLGTEMLDTQFAAKMTGLKGGLSEAIARQLERQMGVVAENNPAAPDQQPGPAHAAAATGQRAGVRRAAHRGGEERRRSQWHPGVVHGRAGGA